MNVDESLRAAGEHGRIVLENAAAAAEPTVRTDPQADWRKHCVRHAYINVPETSPIVDIVRRRTRHVFPAAAANGARRIVLITADYGIEPASLVATHEALAAHMAATSDIPPFADQAYEAIADVVVPAPSEWFAYLAIPIHLHRPQGMIRYDPLRGYVYGGTLLGKDRVKASEALLTRVGRLSCLPSFEDLCGQVESTLHEACKFDASMVVDELSRIEATLDRHIACAGPAEKQVLMLERAAARAVRGRYEALIRQHAAFASAGYGHAAGEGSPSRDDLPRVRPSRITTQEPSDDGAANHRLA